LPTEDELNNYVSDNEKSFAKVPTRGHDDDEDSSLKWLLLDNTTSNFFGKFEELQDLINGSKDILGPTFKVYGIRLLIGGNCRQDFHRTVNDDKYLSFVFAVQLTGSRELISHRDSIEKIHTMNHVVVFYGETNIAWDIDVNTKDGNNVTLQWIVTNNPILPKDCNEIHWAEVETETIEETSSQSSYDSSKNKAPSEDY
jgi:hypothetical protein